MSGKRKYVLFILLLVGFIFASFFLYQQFKLERVIIVSQQEKLNGISIFNEKNLLSLGIDKITYSLQKQNPSLSSVVIEKKLPNTVIITADSRIPIAKISNSKENMYIDREGIIFITSEIIYNLPVINVKDLSIVSGKTDWRVMKAISFIESVNKQSIIIEQISINDSLNSFLIKLTDGIDVLIPFDSDIPTKVSSLQLIVLRFRIEGKNITKIDFSFDKPIVTFASGEKISSTLPAQGF